MLMVVMVAAVSCCGFSKIKKIEGNWTLSLINGATLDVYAAATGYSADSLDRNMTISGEGMVISGMETDDSIYGIRAASEGYEILKNNEVVGIVAYSEEDDSLTLTTFISDSDSYVFKRGTFDNNQS